MESENPKPTNIDEYIGSFPVKTQEMLQQIRNTIRNSAPQAIEKICYSIPTFVLNGNLVHFAAYKNHIGFYAVPLCDSDFSEELLKYKTGKGSVQFRYDQPLPIDLIMKIVKFRAVENQSPLLNINNVINVPIV